MAETHKREAVLSQWNWAEYAACFVDTNDYSAASVLSDAQQNLWVGPDVVCENQQDSQHS